MDWPATETLCEYSAHWPDDGSQEGRLDQVVLMWNKSTVEKPRVMACAHSASPALGRLRQGDHEFEVILRYIGDFIMYFYSTTPGGISSGS